MQIFRSAESLTILVLPIQFDAISTFTRYCFEIPFNIILYFKPWSVLELLYHAYYKYSPPNRPLCHLCLRVQWSPHSVIFNLLLLPLTNHILHFSLYKRPKFTTIRVQNKRQMLLILYSNIFYSAGPSSRAV